MSAGRRPPRVVASVVGSVEASLAGASLAGADEGVVEPRSGVGPPEQPASSSITVTTAYFTDM